MFDFIIHNVLDACRGLTFYLSSSSYVANMIVSLGLTS